MRQATLYFLAFVSGAVVMSYEMLAMRALGADFGSSVIVTGATISVFLAGLAAGYFLGGQLADRWPTFLGLAIVLAVPALLLACYPLYGKALLSAVFYCFERSLAADQSSLMGPLVAATCICGLPTIFLGAVSPYAVRLLVRDAAHVGRGAGSLYALSTVGSIVGTIGTTFYLILWLGTQHGILLMGGILAALAVIALVLHVVRRPPDPAGEEH